MSRFSLQCDTKYCKSWYALGACSKSVYLVVALGDSIVDDGKGTWCVKQCANDFVLAIQFGIVVITHSSSTIMMMITKLLLIRKRGVEGVQQCGDALLLHALPYVYRHDADRWSTIMMTVMMMMITVMMMTTMMTLTNSDDLPSGDGLLQKGTLELLVNKEIKKLWFRHLFTIF